MENYSSWKLIVFGIVMTLVIGCITLSDAQCNPTSGGVKLFGANCEFRCHCLNNLQCDVKTGYCTSGCDFEWTGPECQYRNIALLKGSRHSGNIKPPQYSDRANDRNVTTCSVTGNDSARISVAPWWALWLLNNVKFKEFVFTTQEQSLPDFPGFNVSVQQDVSENDHLEKIYHKGQTCYHHNNSIPKNRSVHVNCTQELYGNQLRLQLANTYTQLVICDLRVSGECKDRKWGKRCQKTCGFCLNLSLCDGTSGDCLEGCELGYKDTPKCTTVCDAGKYGLSCNRNCSANCVDVCNNVNGRCSSCKAGWKGDYCSTVCDAGKYGLSCNRNCSANCVDVCNNVNGRCSSCKAGWKGDYCSTVCDAGKYGLSCNRNCSANCVDVCNNVNGRCSSCKAGWKGDYCSTVCDAGKYGLSCNRNCSANCVDVCNNVNGRCSSCKAGWKGDYCSTVCHSDEYGKNCLERCSDNCIDRNCDKKNGTCTNGCIPGFTGEMCKQECVVGKYGLSCNRTCSANCVDVCNKVKGTCSSCKAGWKGDNCTTDCDDGKYGISCRRNCSANCADVCNKVNGTCSTCEAGWKGDYCTTECASSKWGINCNEDCGNCLHGSCNKFNGSCSGGCKPGYKHTDLCQDECETGTHGDKCNHNCSVNCATPNICSAVDGTCSGCSAGWIGKFCECEIQMQSFPVAGVAGWAFAGVVLTVLLVVVGLVILRKRNQNKQDAHIYADPQNLPSDANTSQIYTSLQRQHDNNEADSKTYANLMINTN